MFTAKHLVIFPFLCIISCPHQSLDHGQMVPTHIHTQKVLFIKHKGQGQRDAVFIKQVTAYGIRTCACVGRVCVCVYVWASVHTR